MFGYSDRSRSVTSVLVAPIGIGIITKVQICLLSVYYVICFASTMRLGFCVAFPTCGCIPTMAVVHFTSYGLGAWGSSARLSICGRRFSIIPFPQTKSLKAEAAAYTGGDNQVTRTKENDEMRRKRVCKRLNEAEDETMCDDLSICVLDDRAMEELNVGSAGCLLLSRSDQDEGEQIGEENIYDQMFWMQ